MTRSSADAPRNRVSWRCRVRGLAVSIAVLLCCCVPIARAAGTSGVRVGVGRADITPVTGVFKGGWSCACARALGQHTRLFARAVVLEERGRKVALVAEDLSFLGAGMVRDAAALLAGRGFSEQNIIDSATHTHSSQSGFMNFIGDNLVLPTTVPRSLIANFRPGTIIPIGTLLVAGAVLKPADPVLYSFMTRQLALAIARADDDLRPGAIGWGRTDLLGVTENRSLEAHLADYGINEPVGRGKVSQDPGGYPDTIDPAVDVLRVDQYRSYSGARGPRYVRRVPVGMFSTFANHGTVVKANFSYFTADHQAAAERVVEAAIRTVGRVPAGQAVVNAFANSDAGDVTSGIQFSGPADAEYVGRREAAAMLAAWRAAGRAMTNHPAFALRFTRMCFCGQRTTGGGPVDTQPIIGLAAAAGSEEGRTVFYYDKLAREGLKQRHDAGPQGDKLPELNGTGGTPQAVPLTALRLGDRLIVTVPGEATVGVGKLLRKAVQAVSARAGIKRVVLAGYADEYVNYLTTPAEYEQQNYEGGFTVYGHYASLALRDGIVALALTLVHGQPAPPPYPYDPNQGVHVTADAYGTGAAQGTATAQPAGVVRLGHTAFAWHGDPNGLDRPVDRAYVTIQRHTGPRWRSTADDLGMEILWSSDSSGNYRAQWEVPLTATPGTYRFLVTAKRYKLASQPFVVIEGAMLEPVIVGAAIELRYPQPFLLNDWTYRPAAAASGSITFITGRKRVVVRRRDATRFPLPAGANLTIPARGARDQYGNTNPHAIRVR
jgi:neutral ceramidase